MTAIPKHPEQQALEVLSSLSYRTGELSYYLQEIALGVSKLIGVDWSVVTLCQSGFETVLASSLGMEEGNPTYSLHGFVANTVVQTGHSLVVEDTRISPECGYLPEGYQAYLGVPLLPPQGEVIGTVCAFHRQPRHFTAEEVRLAEIFAERAATAIDNYQLYQQQQQVNLQLQAEIRERKEVEQALRESEARFRALVEQAVDAFLVVDAGGRFLDANQRACENLGYTREELLMLSVPDVQKKLPSGGFAKLWQQLAPGQPVTIDGIHQRKDGTTFPVEVRIGLLASGEHQLVLALARDVTERKRAEQEMLKAIAALAEVGELAAMIVHEVRNPLTTVLMGLNSLRRLNLPVPVRERLTLSLAEAERIRNLLKEILLYAKPHALQQSELELNGFITEMLEPIHMMPSALNRQIEFVPAPAPIKVWGDKDKLKQVFINLVDNACEAIAEGEVVTWSVEPDPITNHIYIRIHNRGEPIPLQVLPKLTKPFYTTKPSGTGLGLAIVKRIVDAHGGELLLASSEIEGTVVSVRLPLLNH